MTDLQLLLYYIASEQKKCEGEDNWTIIGNMKNIHCFLNETSVKVIRKRSEIGVWDCQDIKTSIIQGVYPEDLENRQHLDTDRYNALEDVKKEIEKIQNSKINLTNKNT